MIEIVESSRLLGVTKSLEAELEKLPLVSHATAVHFLKGLLEHRQITEQILKETEIAEKNNAIGERQLKLAEAEQARQAAASIAKAAENLPKLVLAT
jgi:hypothetical protein